MESRKRNQYGTSQCTLQKRQGWYWWQQPGDHPPQRGWSVFPYMHYWFSPRWQITSSSASDLIVTKALITMNVEKGEPWIPWTAKTDWEFIDRALYFKHQLYVPELACHNLIKSLWVPCQGIQGILLHTSAHAEELLVAWDVHFLVKVHLGMRQLPSGQGKHSSHGAQTLPIGHWNFPPIFFHISRPYLGAAWLPWF